MVVSRLKISLCRLQDNFLSWYIVHWFVKALPGLYAGGFLICLLVSLAHAFVPTSLFASFSLTGTMGGPEISGRTLAVQTSQSVVQEGHLRPYAYSAASGAVYGWPSANALSGIDIDNGASFANTSPIIIYSVQEGDTVVGVAEAFHISPDTVVQANGLTTTELAPGQKLVILPISGLLYEIQPGDTPESVSSLYNVSWLRIQTANGLADDGVLSQGEKIIIPGATPKTKLAFEEITVPGVRLRMPTLGWNWGILHQVNAVDIANSCGTPVYASANGTVVETIDRGWNNGYGTYILISHPNKVQTRYAHLSALFVSEGMSVQQGQLIGAIGKTGKVDGVSGCHLHFEVLGAGNPFAR